MSQHEHNDSDLAGARERMLTLLRRHIRNERVLDAMARIPREEFVTAALRKHAYEDRALPLAAGQTISQPLMVALMTEALDPRPDDRVLEVGTGSGYQAAVLSMLVRAVVSIERVPEIERAAEMRLASLGYGNVSVREATTELGWRAGASYDGIIVTAGAPHVPRALVEQLSPQGRLVIPVGDRRGQQLIVVQRTAHGVELARLGPCAFVPLVGRDAWPDDDRRHASIKLKVG